MRRLASAGRGDHVDAADERRPGGRDDPGGEHPGGGRLAGAVRAEQPEDLAALGRPGRGGRRPDVARVHLGQAGGLDGGRPAVAGRRGGRWFGEGHRVLLGFGVSMGLSTPGGGPRGRSWTAAPPASSPMAKVARAVERRLHDVGLLDGEHGAHGRVAAGHHLADLLEAIEPGVGAYNLQAIRPG